MTLADILWAMGLTLVFEAVTCFFRFAMNLQSTRDTRFLAPFTARVRIHHAYGGAALALLAPIPGIGALQAAWLLRIGIALVASDLLHHFVVLKQTTGEHQFDLVYPEEAETDEAA